MNILRRIDLNEAFKDLYIKYDGSLIASGFGNIIDLSFNEFDTERLLIKGELNIKYLSKNEVKIKGKISEICIK